MPDILQVSSLLDIPMSLSNRSRTTVLVDRKKHFRSISHGLRRPEPTRIVRQAWLVPYASGFTTSSTTVMPQSCRSVTCRRQVSAVIPFALLWPDGNQRVISEFIKAAALTGDEVHLAAELERLYSIALNMSTSTQEQNTNVPETEMDQ